MRTQHEAPNIRRAVRKQVRRGLVMWLGTEPALTNSNGLGILCFPRTRLSDTSCPSPNPCHLPGDLTGVVCTTQSPGNRYSLGSHGPRCLVPLPRACAGRVWHLLRNGPSVTLSMTGHWNPQTHSDDRLGTEDKHYFLSWLPQRNPDLTVTDVTSRRAAFLSACQESE